MTRTPTSGAARRGNVPIACRVVMPALAWAFVLMFLWAAAQARAAEAVDTATDTVLEARVNAVSAELRCLVCQNQSLADSHAGLAIDLKNQVREQLRAGRTDDEVVAYMTQRYGDFIRYRPAVSGRTLPLWLGPFLLLALGMVVLLRALRRQRARAADTAHMAAPTAEQVQHVQRMLEGDGTAAAANVAAAAIATPGPASSRP